MDPVQQVLAQQNSGSAGGEGFGQFFVEGRRQGLARRKLDLEERQEKRIQHREDLMLPLEKRAAFFQAAILGQKAVMNVNELEAVTQLNNAMPEIYALQSKFSQAPDGHANRALIDETMAQAARYPRAYLPGTPGGNLLQNIQAIPMLRQKFQQVIDYDAKLKGTGSRIESIDATGRINLGQRTTPTGNLYEADQLTALETQIEQTTDPAQKAILERQLANRRATVLPPGTNQKIYDANGNLIMEMSTGRQSASAQGGVPQSVIAEAERKATAAVDSVHFANDVIKYSTSRNVGVLGNLNRLGTQILGQVMDVKPGDEFKFAQAAGALKAAAVKTLRSDSNITETERKAIEATLPNITANESDESAKEKAKNIVYIIATSARRQIERAGQPLPRELMTAKELTELVKAKKLSAREAAVILMESPFNR